MSIAKHLLAFNLIMLALALYCPSAHALETTVDDGISSFARSNDAVWTALEQNEPARLLQQSQFISGPAAKYVYWLFLQHPQSEPGFAALDNFLADNPAWPLRARVQAKAEIAMPTGWDAAQVIAWFQDRKPQSWQGYVRLARAQAQLGKTKAAKALLQEMWREMPMGISEQRQQYAALKQWLGLADHRARMGSLLRIENDTAALDLAALLGKPSQKLAQTIIAYRDNKKSAKSLLAKLPQSTRRDPDLALAIITSKRRADDYDGALSFFTAMPKQLSAEAAKAWWTERHITARDLLREGHNKRAYNLLLQHGLAPSVEMVEAEFLAGWIALRRLNQPAVASAHFQKILSSNVNPLASARAYFWLGQSHRQKNPEQAKQYFTEASKYATGFYGQLARQELGDAAPDFRLPAMPQITNDQRQNFRQSEFMQIAAWLEAEGQTQRLRSWLIELAESNPTHENYALLADWTWRRKLTALTVTLSRSARLAGFDLVGYGYPLPDIEGLPTGPEAALVYAIIRQESSFDPAAQSHAGAMGFMQIMPDTGRLYAKRLGWDFRPNWLIQRPDFNLQLGQEILRGKLALFDGNYALTVAAYNAGPARVNTWLREFGDPRDGKIPLVDWIELIPFGETRGYVQRVLENMVVYRYLLAEKSSNRKSAALH